MASLRDTVKDYQEELRDGIAWVAFWKTGRSWNAEYFHLEMGDYLYPEDRSRMEEIKQADPAAVVVNGYYSGYLGENMNLDELTAGVRRHYENGYSNIGEFIEAHDDRLPPELIEEARAAAHAAGLPFSEKAYRDGEEPDPYLFDGSMSMEDYELMHRMIEKERSERMAETILSGYLSNLGKYTEGRPAGEWVSFPTTAEHLKEVFDRIGIDGKHYRELHITEYQSSIAGLARKLTELESLDELNYLSELLKMQFDDDREKFVAAMAYGDHTRDLQDIINLAQNLDCYWLYPSVQSEEDYGHYLIEELDELELPEEAKKYFMYEEYGRDAAINDGGRFTEQGYIYNNRNTFTEWYDGRDVPEEYRVTPQPPVQEKEQADLDASAAIQTAATEQPPVLPIILSSEKPADKMKEITDRLEQGILGLYESDRYADYLRTMSKFHDYSLNNTILIAMQGGNLVKGYKQWEKEFDRHVKPGEKAIKILAPSPFTVKKQVEKIDPDTQKPVFDKDGKPVTEEKEIKIPAFRVVSVFDISQTEGKELPALTYELTGNVEQYKDFFAALEKTSPFAMGFEALSDGVKGRCNYEEKRIFINEGMDELQNIKTAIHEIAHATLHDTALAMPERPDRRTREVQAESVAYAVCQHYGLDTSDYSFGYVAGWSSGRELSELKSSLETIRSAAAEIINSIDGHIAELQKEQAQDAPREKAAMPEYIYKIEANPRTTGDNDRFFLQAYLPQENGRAKIGDVLYIGSLAKCRELMGGLNAGELTQGEVKELYAKAQEAEADKDTFSIYQLKQGDETRDFRFEPYNRLQAAGNVVDKANYELVYSAELTPGTSLEDIYTRFNIDHPKDFKGHSLSVSDVVVLHQNGQDAAHYVDSFGYKEVPEFLQEQTQQPEKINPLKHVEDTIEQNDNNFDGIINNTPTVDELEAKVKAGEQISLVDLAEAIKADKERGKEKPSIRAQLKADKERTGKKKNAKQKSQDLERS